MSEERRLNARSLTVTAVDRVEVRDFLEANHIQGATAMSEAFGLRDGGELVAVMCMKWRTKTEVELVRFATSVIVRGGHSRLLKHAVAAMQPQRVVTFADHAVSDGGLYEQCGFIKDGELRPDYTYYFRGERVHKFLFRLKRFRNDPNLLWDESWTEQQAAAENKIPRIWDYGKTRYVLDIPGRAWPPERGTVSFKQWADMSDEEREAEAQAVSVLFIGLPGVVGAPLVMGPDYWVDVARHLVECGVRLVADSIKHYEPGDSLEASKAAGKWCYDSHEPDETYEQRIARLADEEHQNYLAKVEEMKARQANTQERVVQAEAVAFAAEVKRRKADGTFDGSPHAGINPEAL
ncbi:phage gene 29 protein family protein [Gordonia westfalica]|uniref:Uncharacterized protein n=1 Tax=Gordonia westfalica TaxID=158898 RepID=A0A1H2DRD6_9ACTN|nr:DUF2744 domain-containing protein [Gordonia westfalica]SDT84928.1 Protein of unknown function [Gordonia westfalica]